MYLAIDPGVTTGVALIDEEGTVVDTWAIRDVASIEYVLVTVHDDYPSTQVIAEAPPQYAGHYRSHTQDVEMVVKRHFPDVEWVPPGQWKGHPATRPTSELRGLTQHEKDAVGLARWFRTNRGPNGRSGSSS